MINKTPEKLRKERLIYLISVLLCVIILAVGYFAATDGGKSFYAPPEGSLYLRAKVTAIVDTVSEYGEDGELLSQDTVFEAKITGGEQKGDIVTAYQNYSSYTPFNPRTVKVGDSVIVACFEGVENWNFIDYVRSDAIIILALFFALLLVLFGRKKGIKTVFSLLLTVIAVVFVFMPAILLGGNIYFWAVAVCVYIIVMTLVITSGLSPMSLAASAGCVGGVLVSLVLTFITDAFIHISGNADPHSIYLIYIGDGLDLRALIYASIIIGSVGAVMDVAVDISASLKEITAKLKKPTMGELFRSGLNIGRDVIGTMSNTLVLAYIGGSMCSLLLYFYNNWANAVYLFNIEIIIVEMLKILVGSIGILLTLPLTALVSSWLYTRDGMRAHILSETSEEIGEAKDDFAEMLENAGTFGSSTEKNDEKES
ncbi:MAG: YibE/F family protein [Clostridia bacterium]|nr:YibE/F family protein [Clostridia bacterium]